MASEIWAALIGAFAAIVVAYKDAIRDIFTRGQRTWSGQWSGTGFSDATKTEYLITAKLKQRGRVVTGTLVAHAPEVVEYEIKGRIQELEFMTYFAKNADKNTVNYLVGINRLDRSGENMTGEYVARSRFVERIATGKIRLSCIKSAQAKKVD
ncbi:MAG: hypothetical protein MI923_03020 [Phycisphaerales bacterium]|nr:hypothetical protein [Phycisphaerales bacterium]